MSSQKPSLWRVLSDTSHIITSNSLHFAALSLLFIFPISLFNIIHTLILPPSPSDSHYRRLLDSTSQGQIPFEKSQLLYGLTLILFNIFAVSSVTHTTFHAFHKTPITLSSSLKSILSSFLPLLATKLVYFVIVVALVFASGLFMGFAFMAMMLLGFATGPTSTPFMAVVFAAMVALAVIMAYLAVQWCLVGPVAVVESKYGFAPFERSSSLIKGMRRVALGMLAMLAVMHGIMSCWFSAFAGGVRTSGGGYSCGVAVQMVAYVVLSTAVSVFGVAATAVLFVHCKAVNGESEESECYASDEKKLSQVYVPLPPRDVVDEV